MKKNKILISIHGGQLQAVYSTNPNDVGVFFIDTNDAGDAPQLGTYPVDKMTVDEMREAVAGTVEEARSCIENETYFDKNEKEMLEIGIRGYKEYFNVRK